METKIKLIKNNIYLCQSGDNLAEFKISKVSGSRVIMKNIKDGSYYIGPIKHSGWTVIRNITNGRLRVGDKIYILTKYNPDDQIQETEVTKVGRKYFEVCGVGELSSDARFFKDTLLQDGRGYLSRHKCYLTMKDYEVEVEKTKLYREVCHLWFKKSIDNTSIEQLLKIKNILSND